MTKPITGTKLATNPSVELIADADKLLKRLFPICRSITGDGVRETLSILREEVDFETYEVASGTECYDWKVPNEWNVRDAFIKDSSGQRVIDFQINNVHLVNYSTSIDAKLSFHRGVALQT